MQRHRRSDGYVRFVVELQVPRWAAWSLAAGMLMLGAANATAVVVLLVAR
ncbi:hypothetical protein Jiend_49710 [Micromonospora endophytica]|nr:hypothetical protein Jiend_49710 [Micromonospora endophytica]